MSDDVLAIQRAFPRIYRACHRQHPRGRRPEALSPRFSAVLGHLELDRPTSMTQLARHLGVALSVVSETVDALEVLGLVARTRSAEDRRRVEVRLTREGRSAVSASSVLDAGLLGRVLARLSAAERARAVDGLTVLAAACVAEVSTRKAARS